MVGGVGCSSRETRVRPSSLGRPKTQQLTAWSGRKRAEVGDAMTVESRRGSRPWAGRCRFFPQRPLLPGVGEVNDIIPRAKKQEQ